MWGDVVTVLVFSHQDRDSTSPFPNASDQRRPSSTVGIAIAYVSSQVRQAMLCPGGAFQGIARRRRDEEKGTPSRQLYISVSCCVGRKRFAMMSCRAWDEKSI